MAEQQSGHGRPRPWWDGRPTGLSARRRRVRAWASEHPVALDGVAAVVFTAIGLVAHLATPAAHRQTDPSWYGVALIVLGNMPLALRRRHLAWALALTGAAHAAMGALHIDGSATISLLAVLYMVGHRLDERPVRRLLVAFATCCLLFFPPAVAADRLSVGDVVGAVVTLGGAVLVGDNVRRRTEKRTQLAEQAEREQRERELLAREELHDERTRIARELHDVVAHSVSVMVIQAGAARRQLEHDPQKALGALEVIEATGRQAMQEMRRVLGVLRGDEPGDDRSPQPSLADLPALAAADPSLPVTLSVQGDLTRLPPGMQLSAYRIVQEALTNVRKHAGLVSRVDVTVAEAPDSLLVEVIDDGRGASAAPGMGTGHGLAGMRERVGLANGSLTVGPRPGGGWRVRATFPREDVTMRTSREATTA